MVENEKKFKLHLEEYFPCQIYHMVNDSFVESLLKISEKDINQKKKKTGVDKIYPVIMSDNLLENKLSQPFCQFVGSLAWDILSNQGYEMANKVVSFSELWVQEHHRGSSMEVHSHGYGAQIVGFYFLNAPNKSSRVVFHDPRIGKTQTQLPEKNESSVTNASKMINFVPEPGLLMFSNAWLPHAFTRNESKEPIKFVHFNINVSDKGFEENNYNIKEVEVI